MLPTTYEKRNLAATILLKPAVRISLNHFARMKSSPAAALFWPVIFAVPPLLPLPLDAAAVTPLNLNFFLPNLREYFPFLQHNVQSDLAFRKGSRSSSRSVSMRQIALLEKERAILNLLSLKSQSGVCAVISSTENLRRDFFLSVRPPSARPPCARPSVVLVCIAHSCIKVPWTDSSGAEASSGKVRSLIAGARAHVYSLQSCSGLGENTSLTGKF